MAAGPVRCVLGRRKAWTGDWSQRKGGSRVEGESESGQVICPLSILVMGGQTIFVFLSFYIFDLFCHFLILGVRASMLVMGGQLFLVDNLKVSPASIKHVNFSHVIPIKLIMSSPIHLSSFQNC